MDAEQLRQLVSQPQESAKLDFKIALHKLDESEEHWAELVKDILALTNGNTGIAAQEAFLIVGAGDKLKPDGTRDLWDVVEKTPSSTDILRKVNKYCSPRLVNLSAETVFLNDKRLFVISIPSSPHLHKLSQQLKTPKKEYSPHTLLVRRGDGEETYEASDEEKKVLQQEKEREWGAQAISSATPQVNWQQVCQRMWGKQKENQQIRQKSTAKGFEVNVYVGLGLVQRDSQQRRRGNEHERSQIYGLAEEVIIERYPHDEFLTNVIDADSRKHIAIIGEPGAGKTTVLAAIADHLLKSNSTKVPIFLSLAGLQQRTIQSYLIDVWLPEAFRLKMGREIEASDRESFRGWIAQGEAWLLLDGVDEMGEAHPASALHQIKTQFTDWLSQVRVAVTCRLNVWDAQLNNPLEGTFDVFKTQDFEPEQVSDFIQQWFSKSRKPDRGEILQAKLAEFQRERIRELVRNPLRLSLLCDIFYTNPDAEFPSTKAGLYEQFVRYFYEWKSEQHPTTEPQRECLNAALGKLAIAGLDDKEGLHRFRLPEKVARKVIENDEFELATNLGWLNIRPPA